MARALSDDLRSRVLAAARKRDVGGSTVRDRDFDGDCLDRERAAGSACGRQTGSAPRFSPGAANPVPARGDHPTFSQMRRDTGMRLISHCDLSNIYRTLWTV